MIHRLMIILVAAMSGMAGCGGNEGPPRHRFSGAVSVEGQAVPFGEIIISPDASKKNSGPQGRAPIKDGKFDTASSGGMGVGGGAVIIRVNGLTGPGGKTVCEHEFTAELPHADEKRDISIRKSDANNANKNANKSAPEI
ncbi:MAG: hypothetical protein KJS91_08625 [Planctomycetes bacterium]|nr:hypothetical protein [Planctomycetota bacterium]